MSKQTIDGLVVLLKGIAGGLGFVWLFGFAIGYPNAWLPWVIAALAVAALVGSFEIYKRGI